MHSTDGPLERAMIRCPAAHWFNGPGEFLTCETAESTMPELLLTLVRQQPFGL